MFEIVERRPRPLLSFLFHTAMVMMVVPIAGLLSYWLTPFSGALIGYFIARKRRERAMLFAWIPALLWFAFGTIDPLLRWDASWSHMSHWEYFKNSMFGPDCGGQECLGTIFTAVLLGGISYSAAGYFALRLKTRDD